MTNKSIESSTKKQFRIKCNECGKYPQFTVTKERGLDLIKNHKFIYKKLYNEYHNPILVST